MTSNREGVEPYVILPYARYKALDQKAKKMEAQVETPPVSETPEVHQPPPAASASEPASKEDIGKDVTLKYQTTQMKKLLRHIERAEGSKEILDLPNLDALIRAALTTSRKSLPNEKAFFTFLFENSLGPYVKNRSKINEYYQLDKPWYEV